MTRSPVVLVTGAGGFIGRAAAAALADLGAEVHGAGRAPRQALPGVAGWHSADLLAPGAIAALLDAVRPTHVVHAAWEVTPGVYRSSPANLDWLRVSLALLDWARAGAGRRVVGLGTCFEYDLGQGWLVERRTPCAPGTIYGQCKLALATAFDAAAATGASLAWGRVFYPFGPHEAAGRLVPAVARAALAGNPLDCSEGSQLREFTYVKDLGDAIAALALCEVIGPVNLSTGRPTTIRALVEGLAGRLGGAHLMRFGARQASNEDAAPLIAGDCSRLREEVGWRPARTFDAALDETASWWREQPRN